MKKNNILLGGLACLFSSWCFGNSLHDTLNNAPKGHLNEWEQVFREDFEKEVPLGEFPGKHYRKKWSVYHDGMGVTNNPPTGKYYPSKVISVNKGVLTENLHVENNISMTAAISPMQGGAYLNQLYGKWSVKFRWQADSGYKYAWLLWPKSNQWNDGEIDFAEGHKNNGSAAFMHFEGAPRQQDKFKLPDVDMSQWHVFSCEWTPSKVVFLLDDKVFGVSERNEVPTKPMRMTLQSESCVDMACPQGNAKGTVEIDWVVIYKMKKKT
ncbi:glycoside hydrolase family 16 protein [Pinibacter soli]|uniref:Glycoside hydrolase family 16 protein n=1 Tax=Pinibacter soli TaxID=3044211 RepID=A0ABT6R907_9BACT|nr:glycoside hydrolase family 16 protein [Pinibacter soli]MDI3318377.1 glycoside hydrolase family 16 protein [Pinibacter soli]